MRKFVIGLAATWLVCTTPGHSAFAQTCPAGAAGEDCRSALRDRAFVTAQTTARDETANALARVGARAAARTDSLRALSRDLEASQRDRAVTSAQVAALASQGRTADASLTERLRAQDEVVEQRAITLRQEFPEFAELIAPAPMTREQVQALLGRDEAFVLYARPGQQSTFVWVLTRDTATWTRLPVGERDLAARILALRRDLDPTTGCATRRPWTGALSSEAGTGRDFDMALAAGLYRDLIGPIEASIAGKRHIILAPHGALMSLSFAALPIRAAAGDPRDPEVLRATSWFGIEHAISVLPAASSLRALRCPRRDAAGACVARAHAGGARQAFVGIGAPTLRGAEAGAATGGADCVRGVSVRGDVAEQAGLAGLEPLLGAERELDGLRNLFGAQRSTILSGRAATERAVRSLRLDNVSVIAFSTHGLLAQEAQELAGVPESALVLTPPSLQAPPRTPDAEDDGVLTASEAAALRLDADWVILSACNTAQGGRVGDTALSGLARAFFYAGARALLVSQWPVDDAGAQMLTLGTLSRAQDSGADRAEALRQAMESVLNDRTSARFAHPAIWAPFILVGDSSTSG